MSWHFRVRFRVAGRSALSSELNKLRLTRPGEAPAVYLQPWNDPEGALHLKEARDVLLTSRGYASRDEAAAAGQAWRTALQAVCVRHQIGVDFGDGSQLSGIGAAWATQVLEEEGRRLLADNLGLTVYEDDAPTTFLGGSAFGIAIMHTESELQQGVHQLVHAGLDLAQHVQLACDLFGASFFQPSGDARFLLLMMALESLILQEDRPAVVQAHVHALMQQTQNTDLPEDVRSSLLGSLKALRQESIGQAGRRTVSALGARRYDDLDPVAFFNKCYRVRSDMVHGNVGRPSRQQVDRWAATLEVLVSQLIDLQVASTSSG